MFVSKDLRNRNIAEYLLYMWQIEDLIRANGLEIENIRKNIVDASPANGSDKAALLQWYEELIDMMRAEGKREKGHLQINDNVLIQLTDLHRMLLKSTKYPEYGAEFYRTLPVIVELRARSGEDKSGELETCFNALYGILLMRLQKKKISENTQKAILQISRFVSLLAAFYHKDRIKPLFDKEDYDCL